MASTTTRKRARAATEKSTGPAEPTPAEESEGQQDPVAALTAAYTQAIDARDEATGVIPAVPLDAVRVAYREVSKRQRGNLVARLTGEAGRNVTSADGKVDTGLAVAVTLLSGVFAELNDQERPTPPPHDPVPGLAGILAALDQLRDEVLNGLSDDQRERVGQIDTGQDPAAQASAEATRTAVGKLKDRALNGRSRLRNGTRVPARVVGETIQAAVPKSGEPVTLAALAEETGVSPATLWSRWTANKTPGLVAVEDDKGRKAFKAA
jgi:hypothetical protein